MSKQFLTDRMNTLLDKLQQAIADGQIPMSVRFLEENNVTFSETGQLTDVLSALLKGYLKSPVDEQEAIIVRGLFAISGTPDGAAQSAISYRKQEQLMKQLGAINLKG